MARGYYQYATTAVSKPLSWARPPRQLNVLAFAIFLCTLAAVILRPRRLGVGGAALLGASVAIATGVVPWQQLPVLWHLVWDPTLTLIGLVVISIVLEQAGVFRWAALHVARWGGGSGVRLFPLLVLLGAVVAAVLANDGAVLILTPVVMALLLEIGLRPAAALVFVVGTGFVADTTSLPLVTSNLTNILSARYFGIPYDAYATVMVPVDAVSLAATLLVLWWYFRRQTRLSYQVERLEQPAAAIRDPLIFRACGPVLVATIASYFLTAHLDVPVSAVTGIAALLLIALGLRPPPAGTRRALDISLLLRETPWQIVAFGLGMYVVVYGLHNAGLVSFYTRSVEWLAHQGLFVATLGVGSLSAVLSALTNNLPAVLIGSLGIHQLHNVAPVTREAAVYANIVGCDLGPKLTPIGSLATLMWLHALDRRGERISWGNYLRWGLLLTPPILIISLAALAGWLWLLH